ncbi:unnamed protein product [Closterium sp. NIES-65]|nr:unnamed protein product [Closterium sp. NIES-65]CAI5984212.1 unnamed protein product [Closterium sp. NIES-65]
MAYENLISTLTTLLSAHPVPHSLASRAYQPCHTAPSALTLTINPLQLSFQLPQDLSSCLGFSSSLVLPTPSDPSDPVLPASAAISSVDRVRGPFNPARMEYIQQGMRWEEFEQLLEGMHL